MGITKENLGMLPFMLLLMAVDAVCLLIPGISGETSPGGAGPEFQLIIGIVFLVMIGVIMSAVFWWGTGSGSHVDGTRSLFETAKDDRPDPGAD